MRIVCVHQGFELYGSDRAFVESVAAFRAGWPDADIEVVLPRTGPIVEPLSRSASKITIEPLLVLRRRHLARTVALAPIIVLPALWRAFRRMRRADAAYINTLVLLDYLIVARLFPRKTVVHAHEVAEGGAGRLLRGLLRWASVSVVYNSEACRAAYALPPPVRETIVYNGIASPPDHAPSDYDGARRLRLLMLGRINRTKGQGVLVRAIAMLPEDVRASLEVRIVGSSFDNDIALETALHDEAKAAGLDGVVAFEPFTADPAPLYRWCDILVAPSRLPETLGRVAIEAASHARPALATSIGGLPEVVADGVTGWLVRPDDPAALAAAIERIVRRPEEWRSFGMAARKRYEQVFDAELVARQMRTVLASALAGGGHTAVADPPGVRESAHGRH